MQAPLPCHVYWPMALQVVAELSHWQSSDRCRVLFDCCCYCCQCSKCFWCFWCFERSLCRQHNRHVTTVYLGSLKHSYSITISGDTSWNPYRNSCNPCDCMTCVKHALYPTVVFFSLALCGCMMEFWFFLIDLIFDVFDIWLIASLFWLDLWSLHLVFVSSFIVDFIILCGLFLILFSFVFEPRIENVVHAYQSLDVCHRCKKT